MIRQFLMIRSFSTHPWGKPRVNLTDFLKVGQGWDKAQIVTKEMTTNRTGKQGDDILSTPSMICSMNEMSCNIIDDIIPLGHISLVSKLSCKHQAPLGLGKRMNIHLSLKEVSQNHATFDAMVTPEGKPNILGKAEISISVVSKP